MIIDIPVIDIYGLYIVRIDIYMDVSPVSITNATEMTDRIHLRLSTFLFWPLELTCKS